MYRLPSIVAISGDAIPVQGPASRIDHVVDNTGTSNSLASRPKTTSVQHAWNPND